MVNTILFLVVCIVLYWLYMKYFGFPTIARIERKGATKMLMAVMQVIEEKRYIKNSDVPRIKQVFEEMMGGNPTPSAEIVEHYDGKRTKMREDEK